MTGSRTALVTLAVNVAALGVLLLAATAADSERTVVDQHGAITVAGLSLTVALAADAAVFLHGRRRLALRRDGLRAGPTRLALLHAPVAPSTDRSDLLAWAGAGRFHRPGCALVTGRSAAPASLAKHDQAGRRPCGVCRP